MDGRIFQVVTQINSDLSCHWTVEKMAKSVGLSIPHFIKLFKLEIKTPPHTYLCNQRLEKAKELVESTFLQMQEICTQVGLPNGGHFTRDFKYKFGKTPTEHRKHFHELQQRVLGLAINDTFR